MNVDQIRHQLAYSTWASRRLVAVVETLPEEQRQKEVGVSHKSIAGTLGHIHFGDRIWLSRILPNVDLNSWEEVQEKWSAWASGLNADNLLQDIEYKDTRGNSHSTPAWQIVLHVVNHATLHRGQVMSLLRQSGIAPPQIDLITYYRENNVK